MNRVIRSHGLSHKMQGKTFSSLKYMYKLDSFRMFIGPLIKGTKLHAQRTIWVKKEYWISPIRLKGEILHESAWSRNLEEWQKCQN